MLSTNIARPVILASASPRRKNLLQQIGLACTVIPAHLDESPFTKQYSDPKTLAMTLAKEKAHSISKQQKNAYIIGADTVVYIDGTLLGKPESKSEARSMLQQLSGASHHVVTGVAIVSVPERTFDVFSESTEVHFRSLTQRKIKAYIHTGEPMDKAGAYGIQGAGAVLVDYIHGDYFNVVGFPLSLFYSRFRQVIDPSPR